MANRTMLVYLAVTVLLALTAGVAPAKTIQGTRGADYLDGTPRPDETSGRDGNDDVANDRERIELVGAP